MNMKVLFMRINSNSIYGAQGSINMWEEKVIKIRYVVAIWTHLLKKGDGLKNPGWVLTEGKNEIVLALKICLHILPWIWASIVAALKLKLRLVLNICRKSALWGLPNLMSRWNLYRRF